MIWLPEQDKLLHFVGGQIIFMASWHLTGDRLSAHAITLTVGILKEIIVDAGLNYLAKRKGKPAPHTVDPWDAVATYAGAPFIDIGVLPW